MAKKVAQLSAEGKLEEILTHLRHMDSRDRMRTWGGFVRGIITLVPTVAFIWGLWYFYHHGEEVMADIAKIAAEQAAAVTKMGTNSILEQFKNFPVR